MPAGAEQALVDLLADCVVKAAPYGEQDGGYVFVYLIPTGPIHRAIRVLQEEHGITVRPGFDGRHPPRRKPMTQQPSIGRMVHYVSRGSADGVFPATNRAAVITEVGEGGRVGLAVLNPDGLFFHPLTKDGGVAYFDKDNPPEDVVCDFTDDCPGPPGTWHWPARV